MKIAIFGIGGVGGYYGGKLAECYSGKNQHEVIFIARGKHGEAIRDHGLKIVQAGNEKIVHPDICTDNLSSLGNFDVLIVAVKTYSLLDVIHSVKKNVSSETIIIPLMNGIEPYEILKKKFPDAKVFQGCCYLNAFIESPGVINIRGNFDQLIFGFSDNKKRKLISNLLLQAGINILEDADVLKLVWEKFIFASTLSSIGSLGNESFGEILANPERKKMLTDLIEECLNIVHTKKINIENDFSAEMISKVKNYPFEARTSMQLDFVKGNKTELETFTGYVVRSGEELGVDVSNYKKIYTLLKAKK